MLYYPRGGLCGLGSTSDVQALITQTANAYGVPPQLALAVAKQESGFNQAARGSAGEIGVFQLMPGTAAGLHVDPTDLTQNVQGGVSYLAQMLARYGDPATALAAYNAGPGNVDKGRIPASTQAYVQNVLTMANLVPADFTVTGTPIGTGETSEDGTGGPESADDGTSTALLVLSAAALAYVIAR